MAKQSLRSLATIINAQTRRRAACALVALTIVGSSAPFAQLTLPYSGSGSNTTQLFQITQNGTGITALFLLNNTTTLQPALLGQSISPTGTGVLGKASATSGTTNGVYGWVDSPNGRGVFGTATATSGFSFGVWGQSSSPAGTGVYGVALSPSGSTYGGRFEAGSFDGTGVYGVAVATSGVNYGVVGRTNSPNGYGGYFVGRGYFSGDVGIGTNAPNARLHIEQNSSNLGGATLRLHETESDFARLEFTNTNASRRWHIAGFIGTIQSSDRLNFWNSAAGDIMSLSGGGTVGIGTTSPSYRLHVETNTGGRAIFGAHTATSGLAHGVYGQSASTLGRGVYGLATASTGATYGVYGRSESTQARACLAWQPPPAARPTACGGKATAPQARACMALQPPPAARPTACGGRAAVLMGLGCMAGTMRQQVPLPAFTASPAPPVLSVFALDFQLLASQLLQPCNHCLSQRLHTLIKTTRQ